MKNSPIPCSSNFYSVLTERKKDKINLLKDTQSKTVWLLLLKVAL